MSHLHVSYDKEKKVFQVKTDEHPNTLIEFADEIKAQAFIVAARDMHVFEDIKRMAEKFPQLEARAWRAAIMFLDGHVRVKPDNTGYKVLSQPGTTSYNVSFNQHCTCPDYRNGAPLGPGDRKYCKHILASIFFYRYHQKQQVISANFRGRVINQNVPTGSINSPFYADGSEITEDQLPHARLYRELNGRWPYNQEKLVAWVYR